MIRLLVNQLQLLQIPLANVPLVALLLPGARGPHDVVVLLTFFPLGRGLEELLEVGLAQSVFAVDSLKVPQMGPQVLGGQLGGRPERTQGGCVTPFGRSRRVHI